MDSSICIKVCPALNSTLSKESKFNVTYANESFGFITSILARFASIYSNKIQNNWYSLLTICSIFFQICFRSLKLIKYMQNSFSHYSIGLDKISFEIQRSSCQLKASISLLYFRLISPQFV